MKKAFLLLLMVIFGTSIVLCNSVQATPVLQVYSEPSTEGDSGADHDTWFAGLSGTLWVAGAYTDGVTNITNAHLIFSVPEDSSGTITVDGTPLTTTYDTRADAFINTATIAPNPTIPPDFNNHYPFQDNVSDFLVYYIENFAANNPTPTEGFPDWNADNGIISYSPNTTGEIRAFELSVAGFPLAHVDVIALVSSSPAEWEMNPGSHDVTLTPEPATMLLLGTGLIGLVGLGRKKLFR